MSNIMNKCPICSGKLQYNEIHQYSLVSGIKRSGKLTKLQKREDIGSMECGFISCENGDFLTDCDLKIIEPKELESKMRIYFTGELFEYEEK